MMKRLTLMLLTATIVACDTSPLAPVVSEEVDLALEAKAEAMRSDPLYVEVTEMLSTEDLAALESGTRTNLSPDGQILVAAIDFMEASIDGGYSR